MSRRIKINDKQIDYKIRKSQRAKRLRVAVYCDASVVVTLPNSVNEKLIENFLREKANWLLEKIDFFNNHKNKFFSNLAEDDFINKKEKAYITVKSIVKKYNQNNEFKINNIKIKNQKTRWGSCSKKGNININYKIVYLKRKMAEYIVVHELCHLKEFNHSNKFWKLVASKFPDYLDIRKELRVTK